MHLLEDRVLVRRKPVEEMSEGGIVIPHESRQQSNMAVVVASGEGRPLPNGEIYYNQTTVGETVLLANYAGTEVEVNGEKLLIVRESDILAIL